MTVAESEEGGHFAGVKALVPPRMRPFVRLALMGLGVRRG